MPGPLVTERPPDPGGDPRPPLVLPSRAALSPIALVAVCGVLAAAVLAAAVGATHGKPSGAGHAAGWANRAAVDAAAVVEVLTVVAVLASVVLVLTSGGLRTGIEERATDRRRRSWRQLLIFGGCVALALVLGRTNHRSGDRTVPPAPAHPVAPLPPLHPAGRQLPAPDWWLVIGLLGLAGGGVALASWQSSARRRRLPASGGSGPGGVSGPGADFVGPAVRAGLRDLETETDPRRAVILSYGAMEASLARAGHGRRRSEAPLEYLARVLSVGGVSAAAITELTALFERAGFSPHPVAVDQRDAARDALRRVETELADRAAADEPVRPAMS